ncbi:MAG: tRNA lysidine(34) synthetase TilS [Clostridium sp.]|nr:tRNA lysidine(34) synthetase TilS [Clostridium sp.]MCM1399638.1 tRNA lysidine(34) synthetase TilS [Clostridium sp.]MCM1460498.1 tRNA lysidine(34) synthetase TilS [Bacteroides sp.]
MKFIDNVRNYIDEYNMLSGVKSIVAGISGGADSVCLMLVLCMLADDYGIERKNIFGVHINHMLRGTEADRDELFVKELCDRLGAQFVVFKKDIRVYARECGCSVEEAGRNYRYQCFEEVREKYHADKIAVAHNKGDMAETIIFNIVRGSGLKGLAGIAPVRDNIIRPLLGSTRAEIEAYLAACNQEFCNDSTNDTTQYDRNKIRHNIIPQMEAVNSNAVNHICDVANEAGRAYEWMHGKAAGCMAECSKNNDDENGIVLDIEKIVKQDRTILEYIVREAIIKAAGKQKDIGRTHIKSVVDLIYGESGKQVSLPYGLAARKSYEKLIISSAVSDSVEYDIEISGQGTYIVPGHGSIHVSLFKKDNVAEVSKKIYTKMVDYGKIHGKICIRTPKAGDYIIIDGMGNSKKLSRVFIDGKIDRELRVTWPVVACGSEIIWVIGLRYNERYKVDAATKDILCLKYEGEGEEDG